MSKKPIIILDPGHGLGNRRAGHFDPGAVCSGIREADIAMEYVNTLRALLKEKGIPVVRTRISNDDPCSIASRARIAKDYNGTVMLSFHCNSANGKAQGTETFYRGEANRAMASAINTAVQSALGTSSRGVKTEQQSQHQRLAVMGFQPTFLIELGFLDHPLDRSKMTSTSLRYAVCSALCDLLTKTYA